MNAPRKSPLHPYAGRFEVHASLPEQPVPREQILDEAKLPLRFTAATPCFRSEAGSAGRDVHALAQAAHQRVQLRHAGGRRKRRSSGAGCGVANTLASRPAAIDVCDINPHHLALTALKCEGLRHAPSYGSFYDLLGRGWHPDPEAAVGRLVASLPSWMQAYWREHHVRFRRSLYREGVSEASGCCHAQLSVA